MSPTQEQQTCSQTHVGCHRQGMTLECEALCACVCAHRSSPRLDAADAAAADPRPGVESVGSAGYRKCPPGTFKPSVGFTSCRKCSAGTFASGTGSDACASCPADHTLNGARTQCGVQFAQNAQGLMLFGGPAATHRLADR